MSYKIEVIFKRSVVDVVSNLFRRKAKRYPRVAKFDAKSFVVGAGGLCVNFGGVSYIYPMHKIARIKVY